MVFTVVQPIDHRRILGHFQQQFPVVAHAFVAELDDHVHNIVVVIDLRDASGEHLMPKQGHFLFQRALRIDQVVQPFSRAHTRQRARPPRPRVVAHHFIAVQSRRLRRKQFLHGRLISLGHASFQLRPGGAKPGPPHQVGHQGDIFISHCLSSCEKSLEGHAV